MIRRPPRSTRTDTRFPYTTLFRSSYIEGKLRKAAGGELDDDGDTGSIQIVLAKYLNVEIGLRLRRDRWRGPDYWEPAAAPPLSLEPTMQRTAVAEVGVYSS